MGYFSELDIEMRELRAKNRTRKPANPRPFAPVAGNVGVNVMDERTPARMFVLTDHPHRMGIALFEPLGDPGALVSFPINDFWVLFDRFPH